MNIIHIQPKLIGFPIAEVTEENPNPVEQPAERLNYAFLEFGKPWYRLTETSGKIHDSGHFVETPETVIDDATFEAWLIEYLQIVKL